MKPYGERKMTDRTRNDVIETLSQLSGEQVTNLFLDYFGTQLIDDGFVQHMADEGFDEFEDDDFDDEG